MTNPMTINGMLSQMEIENPFFITYITFDRQRKKGGGFPLFLPLSDMTFEDIYTNYFCHQAENHSDLVHSTQEGERTFEIIDIGQGMLGGVCSGMWPHKRKL